MASLFRKFSFTPQTDPNPNDQSDDTPMISSRSRRKSSTPSTSNARIYGARDYKLSIDAGRPRSSSCTSTLVNHHPQPDHPQPQPQPNLTSRHHTYGSRDYKLMIPKAAENARRNSILEDYNAPPAQVISYPRRYSIPYGARHHVLAERQRRSG